MRFDQTVKDVFMFETRLLELIGEIIEEYLPLGAKFLVMGTRVFKG